MLAGAGGVLAATGVAAGTEETGFTDDFERRRLSADWETYRSERGFSTGVVRQPADPNGQRALRVGATRGAAGVVGWTDGVAGWDGEWTLSGGFYTAAVRPTAAQTHALVCGFDPDDDDVGIGRRDDSPLRVAFGIATDDQTAALRIDGASVDRVERTARRSWEPDTVYRYEITHDGAGRYTCRLWTDGDPRPAAASAVSVGRRPPAEPRVAAIEIDTTGRVPLRV
ncbi:MAG: hypothetical protein J07HB67_02372, partial [halophilic archaeon J07HB67]